MLKVTMHVVSGVVISEQLFTEIIDFIFDGSVVLKIVALCIDALYELFTVILCRNEYSIPYSKSYMSLFGAINCPVAAGSSR